MPYSVVSVVLAQILRPLVVVSLALAVLGCGNSQPSTEAGTNVIPPLPLPDDLLETGLQGQIPLADQQSGESRKGHRKGLRLVGENNIQQRGANFALAWVGDCAYVTTTSAAQVTGISSDPSGLPVKQPLNGMAVIDASNPEAPELVSILQSPAMLAPHESIQGNEARKIIVATLVTGGVMDVYDASDCRHPILKSSVTLPGYAGHALCISDDGMTAYATSGKSGGVGDAVVDLSDLENPKLLHTFNPANHDCGVSDDGNRLFVAHRQEKQGDPTGLVIFDVSDFQRRKPDPQMREVSSLLWTKMSEGEYEASDGASHTTRMFRQGKRKYIYSSDEVVPFYACPWAHGRIIDITDELRPVKVSDITLDVHKSENCSLTQLDLVPYSTHYSGVDDPKNATTLFISSFGAGLRVWDIRDPTNPREIAYWHPKPIAATRLLAPGTQVITSNGLLWDSVPTYVRYRPELGHIWIAGNTAGFQILEFTQTAGPTAPRPKGWTS